MEPIRLHLDNFNSYIDEEVDFTGITVAALVGPNGGGKSTIVDAINVSLFGQGMRGGKRDLSNYLGDKGDSWKLEYVFEMKGVRYKVTRSLKPKQNKHLLEFFVQNSSGGWDARSGKGVVETQKIIENTIKINYETLTSSAIIPQESAGMFTGNMTDTERKKVLSTILATGVWEKIENKAKERIKKIEDSLRFNDARIQEIVQKITKKEDIISRKKEIENNIEKTKTELETVNKRITTLEQSTGRKDDIHNKLADLRRQWERNDNDIKGLQQEVKTTLSKKEKENCLIKDLEVIIEKAEVIRNAAKEELDITEKIKGLQGKAKTDRDLKESLAEKERESSKWSRDIVKRTTSCESALKNAEEQSSVLDQVPCGEDLQSSCPLLGIARTSLNKAKGLKQELQEIYNLSDPHAKEIGSLKEKINNLDFDQKELDEAYEKLEKLQKVSRYLQELESAEDNKRRYSERIEEYDLLVVEKKARIEELNKNQEDVKIEGTRWRVQEEGIKPALEELKTKRMLRNDLDRRFSSDNLELGQCLNQLSDIEKMEKELVDLNSEKEKMQSGLSASKLVLLSSGKRAGVPALMVENAVPEIEKIANEMLDSMTQGMLQVRLDTQMEGKTTKNTQEVLKIFVLENNRKRPYVTFSGAERFLVDIALRASMAKFLAHRAGADIQLFVLDEGLGACEEKNRQAVIDAILSLSSEFKKIIVITHITQIQDSLPQRIEVNKDLSGSHISKVV